MAAYLVCEHALLLLHGECSLERVVHERNHLGQLLQILSYELLALQLLPLLWLLVLARLFSLGSLLDPAAVVGVFVVGQGTGILGPHPAGIHCGTVSMGHDTYCRDG